MNDLLGSHRTLISNMKLWTSDDEALLAKSNLRDFDQSGNYFKHIFFGYLYFFLLNVMGSNFFNIK